MSAAVSAAPQPSFMQYPQFLSFSPQFFSSLYPSPVSAMAQRERDRARFPCRACGVRGHWRADGKCKPEDVRAYMARLATLPIPGQLALPGPSGRTRMFGFPVVVVLAEFVVSRPKDRPSSPSAARFCRVNPACLVFVSVSRPKDRPFFDRFLPDALAINSFLFRCRFC